MECVTQLMFAVLRLRVVLACYAVLCVLCVLGCRARRRRRVADLVAGVAVRRRNALERAARFNVDAIVGHPRHRVTEPRRAV